MKGNRLLFLCSIIFTAIFFVSKTEAAGYHYNDLGVVATSMGGAVSATLNDGASLWYNPAGIGTASGLKLTLDISYLDYNLKYTEVQYLPDGTYQDPSEPIENKAWTYPVPVIAVTYDFGLKNFTSALSFWGVPGIHKTSFYGNDVEPMPGRYSSLESRIYQTFLEAAVAYRPVDMLILGFSFGYTDTRSGADQYINLSSKPFDPQNPEKYYKYDAKVVLDVADYFSPSGSIGLIALLPGDLRFALSYRFPTSAKMDGSLTVNLPEPLIDALGKDQIKKKVYLNNTLPYIFRLGLAYSGIDRLLVEFDYVKEAWSSIKEYVIDIEPNNLKQELGIDATIDDITVPKHWKDSDSYRIGLSYDFGDILQPIAKSFVIRAGGSYETSAIPPQYLGIDAMDSNKYTFSFGFSLSSEKLEWLLSYTRIQYQDVYLRDSKMENVAPAVNVLGGFGGNSIPINNGDYKANMNIVSTGIRARW